MTAPPPKACNGLQIVDCLQMGQHIILNPALGEEGRLRTVNDRAERRAQARGNGSSSDLVVTVQQGDRPVATELGAVRAFPLHISVMRPERMLSGNAAVEVLWNAAFSTASRRGASCRLKAT